MLKIFRFVPLLMIVLFVAWCTKSGERKRDVGPVRVELAELMQQQGLLSSGSLREGALDQAAKRAGRVGMNQLLYASAPTASLEALGWMIDHGAEVSSVGAPEGVPLLHKVVKAQPASVARLDYFLKLGLDPKQRATGGNTLLHSASAAGLNDPVLQALLAKGLRVNETNQAGQQPLHVATLKSIDVLVRAGAEVDAPDASGRTALLLAATERRADVITELLRLGASVHRADGKGRTPLHEAVLAQCEACIDQLLAAGAPRAARDADGLSPVELVNGPPGGARRSYRPRWAEKL